jgi:hypothetical protein
LRAWEKIMTIKKLKGGCQCRAVRYSISAEPVMGGHCHCLDCQKASGAGHSTILAFPENKVKITGKVKSFKSKAESGAMVTRQFCPKCGGRFFGKTPNWPGMIMVMAGSLDDASDVKASMTVYNKRKWSWDHMDPSTPTFEAMPPPQ